MGQHGGGEKAYRTDLIRRLAARLREAHCGPSAGDPAVQALIDEAEAAVLDRRGRPALLTHAEASKAVADSGGNKAEAARRLGVARNTLTAALRNGG